MSFARRLFIWGLLLGSVAPPAFAQQQPQRVSPEAKRVSPETTRNSPAPTRQVSPEALRAARALIDASGASSQFDQIMPMMTQPMTQAFVALAPDRAREIRQLMSEMLKRFSARKGELIEQIAVVYAQRMSIEDMRTITRFYSSGAGRRLVEAQPDIMRQSMMIGQVWGQRIGAELEAEMRRELKSRGIDL